MSLIDVLRIKELEQELARLREVTSVFMGVGDGGGRLFVHGDYPSIKEAQRKIFELEALRRTLARIEALPAKWRQLWEDTGHDYEYASCLSCADELEAALKDKNNGSLPQTDRDAPSPVGPRPEHPEQELEPE